MNRNIIFLLVAVTIFSTLYYLQDQLFSSEPETQAPQIVEEKKVQILVLSSDKQKSQLIDKKDFEVVEINESTFNESGDERREDIIIRPGARYRENLLNGQPLKNSHISNVGDSDFLLLSIHQDEVPYYYEVKSSGILESVPLQPGDLVSFVSTTSSESNLLQTGYQDIGNLTSKVIISNARIIQVIKGDLIEGKEANDDIKHSLVIALKVQDVLRLEMAQKIGDVSIIPSGLVNRYLSIRSSDILEHQFGIRELRGKEQ
ncbi:pilus assembly protein CpaB [Vibrio mimicus]|uniref:pilus assembly protein CpaB n=1 Tax=Vibrio mimicus TaxID=674 RepID=UPI0001BAD71B|nr:pilus assembly protein CpaB [Vibrio mimicus]EEY37240.1 flp pilus assembly protein RcpC/CpaB [Vibrio mimicus MB451]